jgi:hypothetical protein
MLCFNCQKEIPRIGKGIYRCMECNGCYKKSNAKENMIDMFLAKLSRYHDYLEPETFKQYIQTEKQHLKEYLDTKSNFEFELELTLEQYAVEQLPMYKVMDLIDDLL